MNLLELAQRIRSKRLQKRLTLAQLSKMADQTESWLSKVENFRLTPSLTALSRIAEALGTTVSQLLEGLDERPKLSIIRKEEGVIVERDRQISDITYRSVGFKRPDRAMDPFILTLSPGGGREKPLTHEGEEFLLVIRGRVKFEYGGEVHTLNTGDSLYFDAEVEHRLANPYKSETTVLCVFGHRFGW
ncbi:MAG: cupin [Verrucomicrobia bacterium]|nr:MAG: cupin [Verrucomicrobiota bacterium]